MLKFLFKIIIGNFCKHDYILQKNIKMFDNESTKHDFTST